MSKKMIKAPCRCCGQIMTMEVSGEWTEEDAIERVTLKCNCREGELYRTLQIKRQVANENIEALFGKEAAIVEIMKEAVSAMCAEKVESITMNLAGGVKAKASQNSKGEISVERVDTAKKKLTY